MTDLQMTLPEQLCAMMDGELPEIQSRFLRKRLENDAQLRELWSRMHLASSCMKGQPVTAMAPSLSVAVRNAISDASQHQASARSPWLRWGVAASLAVLALAMAPRLMQLPEGNTVTGTQIAATPAPRALPSPATADLVGVHALANVGDPQGRAPAAATVVPANAMAATPFVASNESQSAASSPMPLDAQSPADFPLLDTGDKRSWPRSQLVAGASDPSLEAYLVRHNQMLANDGLGGFVPYIDVVARDPASTQDGGSAADAGADPQ